MKTHLRPFCLALMIALPQAHAQSLLPTESRFLSRPKAVSTQKLRSGEWYFSADGTAASFQAELPGDNPFYQIFVKDLATGTEKQVSPGIGRTTCSWIHPSNNQVLFSSTHHDPQAPEKQRQEIERRKLGLPKQYAWDFDPEFELYTYDLNRKKLEVLAPAMGYDAEASYSPDGSKILFASNRHAYAEPLDENQKKLLKEQPSLFMELYLMNSDGSQLTRLTHTWGYDGGPFFSPNGKKAIFRRFLPDGRTSEIYEIDLETLHETQLTHLGVMSWAPFYHPSGDYFAFAVSGYGGERAFDLFVMKTVGDANSAHAAERTPPVRVTFDSGFDGLPVFSPDGRSLVWSSTRVDGQSAQLMSAAWNDQEARLALGLPNPLLANADNAGSNPSTPANSTSVVERLKRLVGALAAPEQEGRLTGSSGELRSALWAESYFKSLGLLPVSSPVAGLSESNPAESMLANFSFGLGTSLGSSNRLYINDIDSSPAFEVRRDFLPLGFSRSGSVPPSPVVFVGYGIEAPAEGDVPAYSSYPGIGPGIGQGGEPGNAKDSLSGKWVAMFRYEPENVNPRLKQVLIQHSTLSEKLAVARAKGALGVLIISLTDENGVSEKLVPLSHSTSVASSGFGISVKSDVLAIPADQLKALKARLDQGEISTPFEIPNQRIGAEIRINRYLSQGHNVIAALPVAPSMASLPPLIIGAHLDHLGHGETHTSRATAEEAGKVHFGADDNASGSALILELARQFVHQLASDPSFATRLKRPVIFALWSGEEFGTLGSLAWLKDRPSPAGYAYFNADMVGRLREQLYVQGVGSSKHWQTLVEKILKQATAAPSVSFQSDPYLPTDSMPFYLAKTPTLNLFTGSHDEYHTPRDTAERINYVGMSQIFALAQDLTLELATTEGALEFEQVPPTLKPGKRFKVYLGTLPDYGYDPSAPGNTPGMRITGVQNLSPAQKAGLQAGDIVTQICGFEIANLDDYMFSLGVMTPLKTCTIQWRRGTQELKAEIIPAPRN